MNKDFSEGGGGGVWLSQMNVMYSINSQCFVSYQLIDRYIYKLVFLINAAPFKDEGINSEKHRMFEKGEYLY